MMFSSNQELKVSGPLQTEYIESALNFALHYSGQDKHLSKAEQERGCLIVYQITNRGSYCIGWGFEEVPEGWERFSFDFDVEIVSRLIKQQIEKCDLANDYEGFDGSAHKGFIMCDMSHSFDAEERGITNPFYGIVEFAPFYCYYAK